MLSQHYVHIEYSLSINGYIQPSVQLISTIKEIREIVLNNLNTIVFSLFNEEDLVEDESTEGYSIDAWGQYQAAADSLRG